MKDVLKNQDVYAFFSPFLEKKRGGKNYNIPVKNDEGRMFVVNYIGPMVDGKPGFVLEGGTISRPPYVDTYVFVGEIGAGLTIVLVPPSLDPAEKTVPLQPRFWTEKDGFLGKRIRTLGASLGGGR